MKIRSFIPGVSFALTAALAASAGAQTARPRAVPGAAKVQSASSPSKEDPRVVVQRAIDGMGGAERLQSIRSIQTKGIGYYHHLEQSERPEGPWIVAYSQVSETKDFEHGRIRHEEQGRSFFSQSANWFPSTWVFEDGVAATVGPSQKLAPRDAFTAQEAEEALAIGPERVALTALAASDLRILPDIQYRGHAHAVAAFTWNGRAVRLLLSRESGLPSAVESTSAHPESLFWGTWGDVTFRRSFALWMLEKNGVRLPRTTFVEWDGFPLSSQTVDEIVVNPTIAEADIVTIPADVKQAFAARKRSIEDYPIGRPGVTPAEIAPGVLQIRGSWDVNIVKQSDGLVIIEGPISSGYSSKAIAEAQTRYPGLPVKAVITTSDAWPHIGGLREYAARGIPIYALDHNQSILDRLMKSPRRNFPDALAKSPKAARFTFVSKRTTVGVGDTKFEIIPLRTVTGERQMAIWFPELKLLYCSDLFQRDQKGNFFLPQMVSEMVAVVEREHLDVKNAFAMHLALTPWEEILTALRAHTAEPPAK